MAFSGSAYEGKTPESGGPAERILREPLRDQPHPALAARLATLTPRHRDSPDPLVDHRWDEPRASDGLEVYGLRPDKVSTDAPSSFAGLESATGETCAVRVQGPGSIRVDFGVECAGWLEFDSPDLDGSVELSISEHTEPLAVNRREPAPETAVKTAVPVRRGDTFRLELNRELYEGVRFGWIHVRAVGKPWTITAIRLVCRAKPVNYDGHFAASDPLLTRIWYSGAYSVRVNFAADHFGPALVDRGDRFSEEGGVWAGDAYPVQAASLVAFGNADFVRDNLRQTSATSNGIEIYSLYWILSLLDYFWHSGDSETLEGYREVLEAKVEHATGLFADPPIAFCGHDERLGATFEEAERPETQTIYRLVLIRCLRGIAAALAAAGQAELGASYGRSADELSLSLARPGWTEGLGVHALADAFNSEVVLPGEAAADVEREMGDRLSRLSFSPFNQYFILQALARLGLVDEALTTVRDLWGSQLAYGATTFCEVFRPEWRELVATNAPVPNCQVGWTSLGHAWGGGASAWLTHEILGVRPTRPGYAEVEIAPRLGRTLTWVEGAVPTSHGVISLRFDTETGIHVVVLPGGVTATVELPLTGRTFVGLKIDGSSVAAEPLPDGRLLLHGLTEGRHVFEVSLDGESPPPALEEWRYPLPSAQTSQPRGGDWTGAYGGDGWSIFGDPSGETVSERLPPYVLSVERAAHDNGIVQRAGGVGRGVADAWALPADDPRLLVDPGSGGRSPGYLRTQTPDWWGMTMTVDIATTPGVLYRLSAYFLDADQAGRELVIELIDLVTRKLLAAPERLSGFGEGRYLTFSCDRSVRIRVNHLRGPNAVLSGLFFDPVASSSSP